MPEIDAIKAKSYDETTMGEAIVLFLVSVEDEEERKKALNRIDYIKNKEKKNLKKGKTLSFVKE